MELGGWLDLASGRLVIGLMIFVRFAALLFSMPLFSNRSVPPPVRIGLSGALALLLTPLTPVGSPPDGGLLVVGLLKEAVVGLVLGWTATLFFATVQMAGEW